MNLRKKVHAETRRRGEKTEEAFYRLFQEPRLLQAVHVPNAFENRKGVFQEPQKGCIVFQRLTRSHPSPFIPLPVEGRGSRDGPSSLFLRQLAYSYRRYKRSSIF